MDVNHRAECLSSEDTYDVLLFIKICNIFSYFLLRYIFLRVMYSFFVTCWFSKRKKCVLKCGQDLGRCRRSHDVSGEEGISTASETTQSLGDRAMESLGPVAGKI